MIIQARIYIDEDEIPEELEGWEPEDWGNLLGMLLIDGDGGPHNVEFIQVIE